MIRIVHKKKRKSLDRIHVWTATKDAEECDFGTGSPSFYEAPDMHFVSPHASVLQLLPAFFLLLCIPGDPENMQK
jgi:hypothetical protein